MTLLCVYVIGCDSIQPNTAKAPISESTDTQSTTKKIDTQKENLKKEAMKPVLPPAKIGAWGIDLKAQNSKIVAGDDFARHVNGAWLDRFKIPADKSNYGIFTKLYDESIQQIHTIIEELAKKKSPTGSAEQKVGDYYADWMDIKSIENNKLMPLKVNLDQIKKIKKHRDVLQAFADLHLNAPFVLDIMPDPADTTRYAAILGQAGLGLPDRDYYLKKEERFVKFRTAYQAYIAQIFTLSGDKEKVAKAKAKAIIKLEKKLAQVHWSKADSRDIKKIYNPMTPKELHKKYSAFAWNTILKKLGLDQAKSIIIFQPSAIKKTGKIFKKTKVKVWKYYLSFHLISQYAGYLPQSFDQARFDFYSKTLRGVEKQQDRWKRGTEQVNKKLGEVVGKIYVERHFPADAKEKMDLLVTHVKGALKERLQKSKWMDATTRTQAMKKLKTFEPRIGYPKKWIDYSTLTIKRGDLIGNVKRVREFNWQKDLKLLRSGKVDRDLWHYPPQTVNASYNPLLNQLTFPAGILQAPFFDPNADPAVNYGAIGAVIGHEMGHGFDDQGRRFDEKGLLRDWWSSTSDERFKKRSAKLVEQYNQYEPIKDMKVNGKLTLGENIGDLGGVEMSFAAYQQYLKENGAAAVLDGYTGEQRFFMSWAQVWRFKIRDDDLRRRLLTDPHSPAQYRINGVLRNVDAWYKAFKVNDKNKLYLPKEQRVSIW